jgi:hypothetical protein
MPSHIRISLPRKFLPPFLALALLLASFTGGAPPSVHAQNSRAGTAAQPWAQAAHYIVFERHADGSLLPVFYKLVKMKGPLPTLSMDKLVESLAAPSQNADRLVVSLLTGDGSVVYRNIVQVPAAEDQPLRGTRAPGRRDAACPCQ